MEVRRIPEGLTYSDLELYHHGVKGQRWGVRRYQNADGSLTEAGRKKLERYKSGEIKVLSKMQKGASKREQKLFNKFDKALKDEHSEEGKRKKLEKKWILAEAKTEDIKRQIEAVSKMTLSDMKKEQGLRKKEHAKLALSTAGMIAALNTPIGAVSAPIAIANMAGGIAGGFAGGMAGLAVSGRHTQYKSIEKERLKRLQNSK